MYSAIGAAKYNMGEQTVASDVSGAANGAVVTSMSIGRGLSEENPVLWIVGIIAVTAGLAAFSVSGRVGKFSASASAGK